MNSHHAPTEQADFETTARGLTRWDVWAGLVPLLALSPMLFFQIQGLWSRAHMQFFPLAIAGAAFFAYFGWRGGGSTHPVRRWSAIGVLGLAVVTYGIGVWKFSPWLSHLAAIMTFFAWGLGRCGNSRWPSIGAWTALLLTTLPLPLNKDVQLIQALQSTSSWACGYALDALSIPFLRLANVIQIRDRQLFVEEACSGIGSLYALLAVGILLLILNHRSLLVAILSLLTVPVWAMIGNFLRLLTIVIAQHAYDRDLSHGTDHDLLGLATFLIAALCFWLTELFFARMLQPVPVADAEFGLVFYGINRLFTWPLVDDVEDEIPEDEDDRALYVRMKEAEEARRWKFAPMLWTENVWAYRSVIACASIMLILAIAPAIVVARGGVASISFGLPDIDRQLMEMFPTEEALPLQSGELQRTGYRQEQRSAASNFGEHSVIWEYEWKDQQLLVSMDFPFDTWHQLSVCYRNSGWLIEDQRVRDTAEDDISWPWEEMEMVNDLGGKGYVFFCAFTEDMQPFTNVPGISVAGRLNSDSGIVRALTGEPTQAVKTTYQIQLYFESGTELSRGDRQMLREQFLELRSKVMEAAAPAVTAVAN